MHWALDRVLNATAASLEGEEEDVGLEEALVVAVEEILPPLPPPPPSLVPARGALGATRPLVSADLRPTMTAERAERARTRQ